jgi:hypothetical protein
VSGDGRLLARQQAFRRENRRLTKEVSNAADYQDIAKPPWRVPLDGRGRFDALESNLAAFRKEMTHELRIIQADLHTTRKQLEDVTDRMSELEKHPA